MNPWLVMVNPHAAHGTKAASEVRDLLAQLSVPAEIIVTPDRATLRDALSATAEAGHHRLVAVGGDGTVNAVVNEAMAIRWKAPPLLGILPAGLGCDLLRTFGIGKDMKAAAEKLVSGSRYPVDVGLAIGSWGRRWFLNVASTGATAAAAKAALRIPTQFGTRRYVMAAALSLPRWRPTQVRLETDRRKLETEALGVVVANAQFFGGGFNIAPRASMMDGRFDILVIRCRYRDVPSLMRKIRRGEHLRDPAVRRLSASEARIDVRTPWPVETDGEPLGDAPVLFRTQSGRLEVMV